ncbi:MAG: helix-turn-helix domain-containing protein [Cyclobacteriaceae bacterium]|nr:helix-turn-helix domain-containing protein [Cyclobacteriaceae bacterium]
METQHLYIKNMMCPSCEIVVRQTLNEQGINLFFFEMGHVEIEKISTGQHKRLEDRFKEVGFEMLYDKDKKIVEQVKCSCREYLDKIENQLVITKLSDYLSVNVGKNYSFLSKLFSSLEDSTIEAYFLKQKIERVKQLLSYKENSLSEIATMLKYSSVHYLSSQFKKIEGCTVSSFIDKRKLA